VLGLVGRLDSLSCREFEGRLLGALSESGAVVVDCAAMEYISGFAYRSSGGGNESVLLQVQEATGDEGSEGGCSEERPQGHQRDLLRLWGQDQPDGGKQVVVRKRVTERPMRIRDPLRFVDELKFDPQFSRYRVRTGPMRGWLAVVVPENMSDECRVSLVTHSSPNYSCDVQLGQRFA